MRLRVEPQSPNCELVVVNGYSILYSYGSPVVLRYGKVYLDERYWDYSKSTGKHRNRYLDENIETTRRKIENGTYELVDIDKFLDEHFILTTR